MSEQLPRRLHWGFLGRIPYAEGLALQEAARAEVLAGSGPERLFLLEHEHVYTLGRNAQAEDVLLDDHELRAQRVEVAQADRGGKVTYHGPGQLVGYPVVSLHPDRRDVRRYVRDLQEVLLRTLLDLGVEGELREGVDFIGVWAGGGKIASIGVHLRHWVTTHGFALNLSTDLSLFAGIVPCGLSQVRMTSVEELTGRRPPLDEAARICAEHFSQVFGRTLVEAPVARAWSTAS